MLWVIARACVQSITIDEADAYLFFAAPHPASHWLASSGNHLLNSLIMRLFTSVFGLSPVTVRMPSLIGAAIYICAMYYLVRLLSRELKLQLPLFICLVYNPFVMDYLVAGRGYCLATAFLAAAIVIAAWSLSPENAPHLRPYKVCSLCSLCAALSFCGTYSFAIVDATALGFIFWWVVRTQRPVRTAKLLAACIFPGLLLTAVLAGSILVDWRNISLAWGAKSLRETFSSVIDASYYQPNPYLLNPPLYAFVSKWHEWLFPLLGIACLWQLIWILLNRSALGDPWSRWRAAFALGICGTLAVSLTIHRLMYRFVHILMPLGRRAVFIAPLCMMAAGVLSAMRAPSRIGSWARRSALAMLCATAVYFVACLRLTYFMEWEYDADAKNLYSVLAWYNHQDCVTEVSANWRYVAALNFYRVYSGREDFLEIPAGPPQVAEYPPGKPIYVVFYPSDRPFIDREKLKVVYHDRVTEAAIAIRPEVESAPCRRPPL
ncbi:MAG: hypothetical protein LAP87_06880 [Acidobacteriia bacterium]|nr:hypothetical protein [Terriglobia bacterium]